MKAVVFDAALPRYLATQAIGAVTPRFLTGVGRCTRLADIPEPDLPGEKWIRVRTLLGGICGSDLNLIRLSASPSTSPFSSFPFVIGHENVGVVCELGKAVRSFALGDRVVANPLLACRVRDISPPCPQCASGQPSRCENFAAGVLPAGMLLGTTRGLGGSWGEFYLAHESQLLQVPEKLDTRSALLLEPFASVLWPILSHPPRQGAHVLVIGAGTIGLLAIAALRALVPSVRITALARHAFQDEEARRLGAAHVVRSSSGDQHFEALSQLSGGRLLKPILGKRIQVGGFDATMVCVANDLAVEDALRFTRSGGTVYLIGNVSRLRSVDWTPLWMKEITLRGSVCYNEASHEGQRCDAFEMGLQLLASGLGTELDSLVTHRFPISKYRKALHVAAGKSEESKIKVTFAFSDVS